MGPSDVIVCGKLDNQSGFGTVASSRQAEIRLDAKDLVRHRQVQALSISASTDKIFCEGRNWTISEFLSTAAERGIRRVRVLTAKEYLYIAEQAASFGLRVDVFEDDFPIFSGIKFSSNLPSNLAVLNKCLRKTAQLNIRGDTLSQHLAQEHWRSIARKLVRKNGHDRSFFLAYKEGYQAVFKLKEERPDRVILAVDFNSMYVDSMKGEFCHPAAVEYRNFSGSRPDLDELAVGIYRVRLVGALKGFLLDHHPFRYKRLGRSWLFQMRLGDTVETVLHKNELVYFASFFSEVEVMEGFFSRQTMAHPLLTKGVQLYGQRLYHRRRGDRLKENMCKASMQHMHSASNQKKFTKKAFDGFSQLREFLEEEFRMNLEGVGNGELAKFLMRHKYFDLSKAQGKYWLKFLNLDSSKTVFSLSAQVVANARLKLLQTAERFLRHPTVELCYANTDSLHISVARDEVESFLALHNEMFSHDLGALKIEAIADQGYWFDVGRYWLKREGEVVLFKNKGFNQKTSRDPFVCRRTVTRLVEAPAFLHTRTHVAKLENSFGYGQRVNHLSRDESRYVRFGHEEIRERHLGNLTEAREQLASMNSKSELFACISGGIAGDAEGEQISRDTR